MHASNLMILYITIHNNAMAEKDLASTLSSEKKEMKIAALKAH